MQRCKFRANNTLSPGDNYSLKNAKQMAELNKRFTIEVARCFRFPERFHSCDFRSLFHFAETKNKYSSVMIGFRKKQSTLCSRYGNSFHTFSLQLFNWNKTFNIFLIVQGKIKFNILLSMNLGKCKISMI